MIRPYGRSRIDGSPAWTQWTTPIKLTSIMRWNNAASDLAKAADSAAASLSRSVSFIAPGIDVFKRTRLAVTHDLDDGDTDLGAHPTLGKQPPALRTARRATNVVPLSITMIASQVCNRDSGVPVAGSTNNGSTLCPVAVLTICTVRSFGGKCLLPNASIASRLTDENLPRMGEHSPESAGGRWVSGATGPSIGAVFAVGTQ